MHVLSPLPIVDQEREGMTADFSASDLKDLVRTIPDFPKPGIQFYDITTLIAHPQGMAASVKHLARMAKNAGAQKIAGMEARGFIFGAAVAVELGVGFVPIRKAGKLPCETIGIDYDLEYGTDRLEMDPQAVREGERVIIVDDLIATGGTALAAGQLLRMAKAQVDHALFVIDLPNLGGADNLRSAGIDVGVLMDFEGG